MYLHVLMCCTWPQALSFDIRKFVIVISLNSHYETLSWSSLAENCCALYVHTSWPLCVVRNVQNEQISVHSFSSLYTADEITRNVRRSFESCWATSTHCTLYCGRSWFFLKPLTVHKIGVACEVCSGWSEYCIKTHTHTHTHKKYSIMASFGAWDFFRQ
jgi:hypothetical protein